MSGAAMNKTTHRILKGLCYCFAILFCVFILGWQIFIYQTEKIDLAALPVLPTCVSTIDSVYLNQINRSRNIAQSLMQLRQIPGLTIAVSHNGNLIWSEGFGWADTEQKITACPKHQFRLASVSKLLTAAGMAKLVEQHRLDLDADIRVYVPEFPDKGSPITARQLAGHQSGIRHYRDDQEAVETKHYRGVIASLDKFKDDSLLFKPGTAFHYSSYGYVLLSAVIERSAGKDFLVFMQDEIFTPLHMFATAAADTAGAYAYQTKFYDNVTPYSWDGSIVESPYADFSYKWAGGGFLSTVEDLVKFGNAHIPVLHAGFLKNETPQLLFEKGTMPDFIPGIGLGWMIARDPYLRKVCLHFGAGSGATSFLAIYPEEKLSLAILANLGHAKFTYEHLIGIANPFLDDSIKAYLILFDFLIILIASAFIWGKVRKRSQSK